jgi:hypothetical protein
VRAHAAVPLNQHDTGPGPGPVHKGTDTALVEPLLSLAVGKGILVLSTLIIVLLVLWLLGVVTSYTFGGLVHVLLVVAIVIVLLRLIQGRNPLQG